MPRVPSTRSARRRVVLALAALPVLAGCVSNTPGAGGSAIDVESSATECTLTAATAPSGTLTFRVKNTGDDVDRVLPAGRGPAAGRGRGREHRPRAHPRPRRPGRAGHVPHGVQAGHGRRRDHAPPSPSPTRARRSARRVTSPTQLEDAEGVVRRLRQGPGRHPHRRHAGVRRRLCRGRRRRRRATLYAKTRVNWERIEPVAESFGDLDPLLDAREADLEEGQAWTGWHRIEKDLWPPAPTPTAARPTSR